MIRFLFTGILKDKSRSLLPIIIISIGVALTVLLHTWITGVIGESIELNARFNTGHIKVMTRVHAEDADHATNELALLGVDSLLNHLNNNYPQFEWVERIKLGGLIDFPDETGETRAQGPVTGWAIDLLTAGSKEVARFNIEESLVQGQLPTKSGEALITNDFAESFDIQPGDEFTFFGSTMDGSMAFENFIVTGTIRFGTTALDRGSIIIDINDAQQALMMEDAASEILGFSKSGPYDNDEATSVVTHYMQNANNDYPGFNEDEFAPVMSRLRDQSQMAELMDYSGMISKTMIFIFVFAMSIVLWNSGLLGGLRRYSEFGLRLALGEDKKHIYTTLIYEAILIGTIGSIIGTSIGIGIAYYLQEVGIDVSGTMQNATMMMPSVIKASITPAAFYIGFVPGLFSMVLGNALSGIGIYRRQTANLFKELEV